MSQALTLPAPPRPDRGQLAQHALTSLLEALRQVADPRQARGIRHPLASILGLCILAFVCGRQSLTAVSRFGRQHKTLLQELGFPRPTPPSVPTLSRTLGAVEPANLQRALSLWLSGLLQELTSPQPLAVASVDGKTSCAAGVHMLNIFLHELELVLHQAPVEGKQNEISAFKAALAGLLAAYPFLELLVGDAMFAGAPLCELLIQNGRHYLFQVKADQPELLEKLALVFVPHLHRRLDQATLAGEKKGRLRCGP
jgi:hypothetical protein